MSHVYKLFDLCIRFNTKIPDLLAAPMLEDWDVDVLLEDEPLWLTDALRKNKKLRYATPCIEENLKPSLQVWELGLGEYFRLLYADNTEFVVDQMGSRIWARWLPPLTLEDTLTYLLGPVIGFVLRLRNVVCLHASALAVDNQAIALFGIAGRGKSTTAAAFANLGYPILSDDIVALVKESDKLLVQPAYPRLRLWPESSEILFGSRTALPNLTPNWDKLYLDLCQSDYQFQHEALPLAAIYLLGERSDRPYAPYVEDVSPRDGLLELIRNSTVNYLQDAKMRAQEFEVLSDIIETLAVRRVIPHSDPSRLQTLCDIILRDFRAFQYK